MQISSYLAQWLRLRLPFQFQIPSKTSTLFWFYVAEICNIFVIGQASHGTSTTSALPIYSFTLHKNTSSFWQCRILLMLPPWIMTSDDCINFRFKNIHFALTGKHYPENLNKSSANWRLFFSLRPPFTKICLLNVCSNLFLFQFPPTCFQAVHFVVTQRPHAWWLIFGPLGLFCWNLLEDQSLETSYNKINES